MGFDANLLVVHKQSLSRAPHFVWSIDGVVSLGRVTGIEKVAAQHFQHLTWSGKQRAGICVINHLLTRILADKLKEPKIADFAPRFLSDHQWGAYLEDRFDGSGYPDQADWVRPIRAPFQQDSIPRQSLIKEHNDALTLSEGNLARLVEDASTIIDKAPLIWESSELVAIWLQEMKKKKSRAWKELVKDPVSIAYYNMWQAQFTEMGKIGARIIFLFSDLELSSFL